MNRLTTLASTAVFLSALNGTAGEKPNIIVFLTDDHGYADIGAQGILNDLKTPHLDRLANEGVRFTSGYVTAPISGPSRVGLVTGRYQQRMGMETHTDLPFVRDDVPFPERLRKAGYRTGMVGKLHLPLKGEAQENPENWGFDEFSMKAPVFQVHPNRRFTTHSPEGEKFPVPKWMEFEEYRLDASTRFATQFIERNHKKPFLLYVAYFGPHAPLEAPEKYLSRFPDVTPAARRYALAMISAIDDGVGAVVDKLKQHGIDDNTLIFFLGDNGAPQEPEHADITVSIDNLKRWDGSLNTPMTGEKDMLSEGGIRVPFLARWPKGFPAGQVMDTPVSSLDIAATAVTLGGGNIRGLDGENLIPLLKGNPLNRDALFWKFAGQTAVRQGDWKLIKTRDYGPYLFNLKDDPEERENLIKKHPEKAAELEKLLAGWYAEMPGGTVKDGQYGWDNTLYRRYFSDVSQE